jgi:hypothetical protein
VASNEKPMAENFVVRFEIESYEYHIIAILRRMSMTNREGFGG